MKIQTRTLKKVALYLDKNLHVPLSIDDSLYMRFQIQEELFKRNYEEMRKFLWKQWCNEYLVKYHNGYYESGQLIKKSDIK